MIIDHSTEHKTDLNAKDAQGKTGLYYACKEMQINIVKLLLQKSNEHNIILDAKDIELKIAFQVAYYFNKKEFLEMPIENEQVNEFVSTAKNINGKLLVSFLFLGLLIYALWTFLALFVPKIFQFIADFKNYHRALKMCLQVFSSNS